MKYTIGLDYGTNSVRALIVNVANGQEVGTAVWNYEHGTQGVILGRDPNLARQHPADYIKGAEITIKQALADSEENRARFHSRSRSSASAWTRPAARRCRWMPTASRWRLTSGSPRIRRRWRGCGRTTPAWPRPPKSPRWPKKSARNIWPSAAAFIPANGFSARFSIACAPRRKSSTPRIRGSNWPTTFPPRSRARKQPDKFIAGVCAAGHKAMWNAKWGGYPDAQFLVAARSETRQTSLRALRRAFIRLTAPSADSRPHGRRKPVCGREFPSRSARSTRTSAPSAAASLRERWSKSSAQARATSPCGLVAQASCL